MRELDLIRAHNPSRRLSDPYCRVIVGEEHYISGARILRSARVTLAEGQKGNNCSIELYDPDLVIAEKFLSMSFAEGGLTGLPDSDTPVSPNPSGTTEGGPGNFAGGSKDDVIRAILAEAKKQGVTDRGQLAYILATAEGESNFQFIEEGKGSPNRRSDGLHGRGIVQLTNPTNYARYSKILGQDLLGNPDLALKPANAVFILVHGSRTGSFTGVGLGQFINGNKKDYHGARKVIGGMYPAKYTALAQKWESQLGQYLGSSSASSTTQTPNNATGAVTTETKIPETSPLKGSEIRVFLGYSPKDLVEFGPFLHVRTRVSQASGLRICQLEGQSVRWQLTRRAKSTTYQNMTLKQVAQRIATAHGLTLEMINEGPKYTHLSQDGISDYELLQRECDLYGFRLYDTFQAIHIAPRLKKDFGFVLRYGDNMDGFEVIDSADNQEEASSSATTGEAKYKMDLISGSLTQTKPENYTATGVTQEGQAAIVTTGSASPKVQGTVSPDTDQLYYMVQREKEKRVQGFKASALITATPASLNVTPDVRFFTEGLPGWLSRAWVISTVSHNWSEGKLATEFGFYSPLAPKNPSTDGQPVATEGVLPSGQWTHPNLGGVTVPGGRYGASRSYGGHSGIDFSTGKHSPIKAASNGTVTGAGDSGGGYGQRVVINHGGGIQTTYSHLSRIQTTVGAVVQTGQVIGLEGGSGGNYAIHLHFEVVVNGQKVNPGIFLKNRGVAI